VNGENNHQGENLSESQPELSAMEAALAELRPHREPRFADDVKARIRDALSGNPADPPTVGQAATVKIPLTHYIRIAQFNAAAGGLLAGLFLGTILGGVGVYFAMSRFAPEAKQPRRPTYAAASPFARRLLEADASLTPLERALLEEIDREPHDD
jgi:hypothetical protein